MSHSVRDSSCSQRAADQLTWQSRRMSPCSSGKSPPGSQRASQEHQTGCCKSLFDPSQSQLSQLVEAIGAKDDLTAAAAQGRSRLGQRCFKTPIAAVTLCFPFSGKVTDCHLMQTRTDKMGALGLYQPLIPTPRQVPPTTQMASL